jgi:23S rRNA (uracil1939-C5)-methyltransferase
MRHASHIAPEETLIAIAEEMPERVTPSCKHFGECGGCQLQDLSYEHQLTAKKAMLLDVLHTAGISSVPVIEVSSASPWEYRNRIRLRIQANQIGYSRRASNEFLAIDECPIASPLLIRIALAMRDLAHAGKAPLPEGAAAMELFTDAEEQFVQMSVHVDATVADVSRNAPAQLRVLSDVLSSEFPQLVGAGLSAAAPDTSQSKRVQATQRVEIARWGKPQLRYTVAGREYDVTRTAFFQVNRFLTEEMVRLVVGHRSGRLAYDLFAGAGLFSVVLAERFDQVIAVEIGEPAVSDLKAHLDSLGPNHRVVHATTQSFLEHASQQPDLVVMDPPRAGVALPALRSLMRLNPAEIVYVSCDAGTFARDAKTLTESGYTMAELHLLDLFPQTFHTETIAVFHRA